LEAYLQLNSRLGYYQTRFLSLEQAVRQPYQVLDPFLNNQGAHGHSWGIFGFR
jgi:hypothetical protein